jgi:hypothetical protein
MREITRRNLPSRSEDKTISVPAKQRQMLRNRRDIEPRTSTGYGSEILRPNEGIRRKLFVPQYAGKNRPKEFKSQYCNITYIYFFVMIL